MPFYWVKGYPRPYPNWNTWHTCQDYDALIDWTEQHKIPHPARWEDLRAFATHEFDEFLEPSAHPGPLYPDDEPMD